MNNERFIALIALLTASGGGIVAFLRWAWVMHLADRKEAREQEATQRTAERTERREERALRREELASMRDVQITLAALVERDRRREERIRRESTQIPSVVNKRLPPPPRNEFTGPVPTTNVQEIEEEIRASFEEKRPRGTRAPTRGAHHDREQE